MPNATEAQIKNRIAEFVQELELTVRKNTLEALKDALEGRAAPARRGRPAGSRRGPGRPKGSGRASGNVDDAAAKIVAHVRSNDGQGISSIADATGIDLKTAKKAAIKLLAEGVLKKSGQKRGTVYHVGSGRKPRSKTAKRRGRKATKAKRKPSTKQRAAPRRKARAVKKVLMMPARRRTAPAPNAVASRPKAETDVPLALAVG